MILKAYIGIIIFFVVILVIIKTKKIKRNKLNKKYYNIEEDITQQLDDITATLILDDKIDFILEKDIVVVHSEKTIY